MKLMMVTFDYPDFKSIPQDLWGRVCDHLRKFGVDPVRGLVDVPGMNNYSALFYAEYIEIHPEVTIQEIPNDY